MNALLASVIKEARVLSRDREGLAILFLMPLVFVVIMSLALQDVFRPGSTTRFSLALVEADGETDLGARIAAALEGIAGLQVVRASRVAASNSGSSAAQSLATQTLEAVRQGHYQYALVIPAGATRQLSASRRALIGRGATSDGRAQHDDAARIDLDFVADPALRADQRALVKAALERVLLAVEIELSLRELSAPATPQPATPFRGTLALREGATHAASAMPTSTQQNVPAYSLLAIFMLVVPLSTTLIKERDQGTLTRLRTMPVSAQTLIAGKVIPYFIVNLLQMAFCLAIGRWLIPALGGEALTLTAGMTGPIALLSGAASLAAIGFALAIAMIARTPEQATAFGAAAVLLMAALGGVMVPRMLMPAALQDVALASPMGWALDGFLAVFLRDAAIGTVLMPAAALIAFALACLGLALLRFNAMMRAA